MEAVTLLVAVVVIRENERGQTLTERKTSQGREGGRDLKRGEGGGGGGGGVWRR